MPHSEAQYSGRAGQGLLLRDAQFSRRAAGGCDFGSGGFGEGRARCAGLWGQPSRVRAADSRVSSLAASFRRTSYKYRGGALADLSGAGPAQSKTEVRAGGDHGQVVHFRAVAEGDVRLHAVVRRVWVYDRVSDWTGVARRAVEYDWRRD